MGRDVLPCNGMNEKQSMGNLKEKSWGDIWESGQAGAVRNMVENCRKNCWMIGSAAPAIWEHPAKPLLWVSKNKIRQIFGKRINAGVKKRES